MKRKPRRKRREIGRPRKNAKLLALQARSRTPDLARIRIKRGLSIADVARRTHLSFVTVWRIEKGLQKPTKKTAERISKAIG